MADSWRSIQQTVVLLLRSGLSHAIASLFGVMTIVQQIAYPLADAHGQLWLTRGSVCTFFCASLLHAWWMAGSRGVLLVVGVCGGGGFLAEWIGVHSGWPFGRYAYTGRLSFSVAGVSILVPVAWAMMAWPTFVVARSTRSPISIGAAMLVTWDLFLDPQMVDDGHWRWAPTRWPKLNGIPISNTFGWAVVSVCLLWAMMVLLPPTSVASGPHSMMITSD